MMRLREDARKMSRDTIDLSNCVYVHAQKDSTHVGYIHLGVKEIEMSGVKCC